jgi:hypothetical protein
VNNIEKRSFFCQILAEKYFIVLFMQYYILMMVEHSRKLLKEWETDCEDISGRK